jgi:hypothetical protein
LAFLRLHYASQGVANTGQRSTFLADKPAAILAIAAVTLFSLRRTILGFRAEFNNKMIK